MNAETPQAAEAWVDFAIEDVVTNHAGDWSDSKIVAQFFGVCETERSNLLNAAIKIYGVDKVGKEYYRAAKDLVPLLCSSGVVPEETLIVMATALSEQCWNHFDGPEKQLLTLFLKHIGNEEPSPEIQKIIKAILRKTTPYEKKLAMPRLGSLRRLLPQAPCPLIRDEIWAEEAIDELKTRDKAAQAAWAQLLGYCMEATASKPTKKWLKSAMPPLESVGPAEFENVTCRWFQRVGEGRKMRPKRADSFPRALEMEALNELALKGMVWCATLLPLDNFVDPLERLAIAAYTHIPKIGPWSMPVGNAAIYALSTGDKHLTKPRLEALANAIRVKAAQKQIAKALQTVDAK